jgi:hypothetical protein
MRLVYHFFLPPVITISAKIFIQHFFEQNFPPTKSHNPSNATVGWLFVSPLPKRRHLPLIAIDCCAARPITAAAAA